MDLTMPHATRDVDVEKAVWGGLLILAGLAVGLDQMGWIEIGRYGRYWPLVFLPAGLAHLVRRGDDHWSGVWLLFLCAWLLLHSLRIVRIGVSWPLVLVMVGAGMVFRRDHAGRRSRKEAGDER